MTALARFRALKAGDRRAVVEASVLLALIAVGLKVFPFTTIRAFVNQYAKAISPSYEVDAARLIWAVTTASRRAPLRATCLTEALAADAMLRRRGLECRLCLGVHTGGLAADALHAHAWLERQGNVILGSVENLADYAELSRSL
jgi:hypothetical protein